MLTSITRPCSLVLLILVAAAPGALPAGEAGTTDASTGFQARLHALDEKAATVLDLSASFVERKYTALLKEPLISTGTIQVVGSRVLWETRVPHVSKTWIDESRVRIYYPQRRVVEEYPLDDRFGHLFSTPVPRLSRLRGQFDIEPIPKDELADAYRDGEAFLAVRLTPTDEALRQYVKRIDVMIDVTTACAAAVDRVDADDERTVMTFSRIKTNQGLDADSLDLSLPEGTRVVQPLSRGRYDGARAESREASP